MRTTATLICALLLAVSGFCQQPSAKHPADPKAAAVPALPPDAPTKEQLTRLFDVMEVQKQIKSIMASVGASVEKMLPSNMGDLTEKQKDGMAKLNAEMLDKMMDAEFIDSYFAALIPIYQRHFSKSDVDDLISFYASPLGQKFLHEQPQLTQESLATVLPLTQKHLQDVMGKMDYERRLKEIFAEEDPPASQPKK